MERVYSVLSSWVIQWYKTMFQLIRRISLKQLYQNFKGKIRNRCSELHSSVNKKCENILTQIYTLKLRYILSFYVLLFLLGRILAIREDFPWSLVHQLDLTAISLLGLYMLQYLHTVTKKIRDNTLGINILISGQIKKLNNLRMSPLNFLCPIYPVLSFIYKIVQMKYVPTTPTGLYAIFMASSAFYIALICYFQLVMSTYAIYKLTRIDVQDLPFSFPNDLIEPPEWLKELAAIYKKTQFSFFTVGFLFTTEYILLIPEGIDILDDSGKLNLALPYDFWSTWIVIFVFIIIAFPAFWLFLRALLLKLSRNLNKKVLNEMKIFSPSKTDADVTAIWSYHQLVNHAIQFDKTVLPKGNIYPLVATSLSFFLNLAKLFELLGLPLFGGSI